ncbi:ECF transporter S component [Enterococcus sp. LJL120]
MKSNRVQKMVVVAMLAAMATVLQTVLEIPVIPAFSFMKIDFSDLPVMISMFLFGPMAGIATALIRSIVHLSITGFSVPNMIGDAASFLATTVFTLPMYYFFNHGAGKIKNKAAGVFTGILCLTIFMSIANYFVITPMYLHFFGLNLGMSIGQYILVGVVPFNIIKGGIVSAVFLVLYTNLFPWLSRQQKTIKNHSMIK